jgi:HEPN domain-containing protein
MAGSDLEAARLLLASDGIGSELASYHAQQAAEKALKSMLVSSGADVPRTHDLDRLHGLVLEALGDAGPGGILAALDLGWMTHFGLGGRYPDGASTGEPHREVVQAAIDLASVVLAAARRNMGAE